MSDAAITLPDEQATGESAACALEIEDAPDAPTERRRRRRRHPRTKRAEGPAAPAGDVPTATAAPPEVEPGTEMEFVSADADEAAAAFEALTVGDAAAPKLTGQAAAADLLIVDSLPGADRPRLLMMLRRALLIPDERGLPRVQIFRNYLFKANDCAVFTNADGGVLAYVEDERTGLLAREPDGTEYVVAVPDFDNLRRAQHFVGRTIEGVYVPVAVDPECKPGERAKCFRPHIAATADVAIAAFGNRIVVLRREGGRWVHAAPAPNAELVGLLELMRKNHEGHMITCVAAGGTDVAFAGLLGPQGAFLAAFDVDAEGRMRTRAFYNWGFGPRDPAKAEYEPAAEEMLQPCALATNGLGAVAALSPAHIVIYEAAAGARYVLADLGVSPKGGQPYTLEDVCYAADGACVFALASNGGVYRVAEARLRPVCTLNPRDMVFKRFHTAGSAEKAIFSVY